MSVLWRPLIPIAWAVLASMVLSGCSGMKAAMKETLQSGAGPPEKLEGALETTGILLIDTAIIAKGLFVECTHEVTDAWVVNVDDPANPIHGGCFVDGLVILHNLEPGTYRVYKLRSWGNATVEVVIPPDEEFLVEVSAGVPAYFGRVTFRDTRSWSAKLEYEWESDQEREHSAWAKLKEKYGNSAWVPRIDERMSALQDRAAS